MNTPLEGTIRHITTGCVFLPFLFQHHRFISDTTHTIVPLHCACPFRLLLLLLPAAKVLQPQHLKEKSKIKNQNHKLVVKLQFHLCSLSHHLTSCLSLYPEPPQSWLCYPLSFFFFTFLSFCNLSTLSDCLVIF